jgi:hypothetical protein
LCGGGLDASEPDGVEEDIFEIRLHGSERL